MWPGGGAACTAEHRETVPPLARLTAVETAQHTGYNRMVFVFGQRLPSYDVRFVRALTSGGTGEVIPLDGGGGVLQVRFDGAEAHALSARPQSAALSRLRSYAKGEDFEGVVRYGLGLAGPAGADEQVQVRVAEGQRADGSFTVVVDVAG